MTFIRFNYVLKRRDAKTGEWVFERKRVHILGNPEDPAVHREVIRRIGVRMVKRTFKWAIDKIEHEPGWIPKKRHLKQLTWREEQRKKQMFVASEPR